MKATVYLGPWPPRLPVIMLCPPSDPPSAPLGAGQAGGCGEPPARVH